MSEATQITYGEGTVNVELYSESLSNIPAPTFRFGNYEQAVEACFTQKELGEIYEGEHASLTFSFVMSDNPAEFDEYEELSSGIAAASKGVGKLSEGVIVKMHVTKNVDSGEEVNIDSFSDDVELQVEIPLFLVRNNRDYFLVTDSLGACKLYRDKDAEDDTLTVSTNSVGTSMIMYRDFGQDYAQTRESGFRIAPQHIFFTLIVMLLVLWYYVTGIHRKKASNADKIYRKNDFYVNNKNS